MNKPKIGGIIPFGEYDWRVLDVQGDKALIITEDVVEQRQYHREYTEITWKTCDLRKYLNGEFFSKFDKSRIVPQTIQNPNNLWYGTSGGNPTQDSVFLLSLDEVCRYFGDSTANLKKGKGSTGSDYYIEDANDKNRVAKNDKGEACWWWLRSPGGSIRDAAIVYLDGFVSVVGLGVSRGNGGVRPALWLKL
jgi:hypothetical protein